MSYVFAHMCCFFRHHITDRNKYKISPRLHSHAANIYSICMMSVHGIFNVFDFEGYVVSFGMMMLKDTN